MKLSFNRRKKNKQIIRLLIATAPETKTKTKKTTTPTPTNNKNNKNLNFLSKSLKTKEKKEEEAFFDTFINQRYLGCVFCDFAFVSSLISI